MLVACEWFTPQTPTEEISKFLKKGLLINRIGILSDNLKDIKKIEPCASTQLNSVFESGTWFVRPVDLGEKLILSLDNTNNIVNVFMSRNKKGFIN